MGGREIGWWTGKNLVESRKLSLGGTERARKEDRDGCVFVVGGGGKSRARSVWMKSRSSGWWKLIRTGLNFSDEIGRK